MFGKNDKKIAGSGINQRGNRIAYPKVSLSRLPLVNESRINSKISSAISIRSLIIAANQPTLFVTEKDNPIFTVHHKATIVDAVVVVLQMRETLIGMNVPAGIPVNKTVPESCIVTFMLPVVPTYTARVT